MRKDIAELHIAALPQTWSSRRGVAFVACLYAMVEQVGYIVVVEREGMVVGVLSGIGPLILTLAVLPTWQGRGIGRELITKLVGRHYVYTGAQNIGFYTKMGFNTLGKIGKQIVLRREV